MGVGIDGGASAPESVYPAEKNQRQVAVVVPPGDAPEKGWPFVFIYEFINIHGNSSWTYKVGGMLEDQKPQPLFGLTNWEDMFHVLVENGFALLLTSQWDFDILYYTPDEHHPEHPCDPKYPDDFCWNKGDNPDMGFQKALFDKIHSNTLLDGLKLDYSRMGKIGYSTGAQMVSRAMNEYPKLRTNTGVPFPEIKAALLIGGGSYHCYSYEDSDAYPLNYLPCDHAEQLGCCPNNVTETVFDSGEISWNKHPPTLLLQASWDIYAAWSASKYYYDIMSTHSQSAVCRIESLGFTHGMSQCHVLPVLEFMKRYV